MKWANLTDRQRVEWCDWVVDTCLLHGSTRYTAFSVAGLFAAQLDADMAPLSEGDDE